MITEGRDPVWIVDTYLTERYHQRGIGYKSITEACRELGIEVIEREYKPMMDMTLEAMDLPLGLSRPVVLYGTHEFVSRIHRLTGKSPVINPASNHPTWTPGAYYRVENLSYSAFSVHLGDLLLNDDFVIVPLAEFIRRKQQWFKDIDAVFVKPNAVTKAFTGFVIWESEWDHEINALSQVQRPAPETLVVVARPKVIKGEFRFFIVEGKVVTGSEYRWDGRLDVRTDIHPACQAVAEEVARRQWQADTVYVVDVALTEIDGKETARVVELNTFCCAGIYASDTVKLVRAVTDAAVREFLGEEPA